MPTFYFDSVNGDDSNSGTSWNTAWRGITRQIATYIGSGNIIWLRGDWDNQVGGTFDAVNGFELRAHDDGATLDCRTRHVSGWTNVNNSRVWKKSFNSMVHRVIFGSGDAFGFVEGADVAKRYIMATTGNWTGTAASDAQVVAALDAGTNQARIWYWDGVSSQLYVLSTNNSTNPDVAHGGVWTVDGSDSRGTFPDRRRWRPFVFTNTSSLFFGPVHIRGATRPLMLSNTSGTLEPYITEYPHYQWPTVQCEGSYSGARPSLTINSPRIYTNRPYFNEYHTTSFDDGNGIRNMGGSDIVTIERRWDNWAMYNGLVETGHGGVAAMWFMDLSVNSALVRGTYFDGNALKYGRAFGLQQQNAGQIGSFIIENCTIDGQSVNSQINVDNLIVRNCVFRNGKNGWIADGSSDPQYVDKYDPTYNWWGRFRNSCAISLMVDGSGSASNSIVIEDNIFYGQYDEVLALDNGVIQNNWYFRNNACIRVAALAGPFGQRVLKAYTANGQDVSPGNPAAAVSYSGNTYDGYSLLNYGGDNPSGFSVMSAQQRASYVTISDERVRPTFSGPTPPPTPLVTGSIRLSQYGNRLFRQAATFPTSLHNFTVCGFLKLAAPPGGSDYAYIVFIEGAGNSSGNAVYIDSSGNFKGNADFNAADTGTVGTFIPGGASGTNWYFFAWRGTGTGANGMRVSFKPVGAGSMTTVPLAFNDATTGIAAMTLGSPYADGLYGSRTFNGYFAHLKIFNRALNDAEILTESTQATPAASNLLSYHSFVNTSTSAALQPTQGTGAWIAQEVTPTMSTDGLGLGTGASTLTGSDTLPFSNVVIAPAILTLTLDSMVAGTGGSRTLEVTGTGPITLSTFAGTPPAGTTYSGLTINVPSSVTAGAYTWTVRATGPTGLSDDQQYTLTVSSSLVFPSIITTSLAGGITGAAYSQAVVATGTAPITWSIASGALPAGLSLSDTSGVISGTPSVAGTSSFTVAATNAAGSRLRTLSIAVTQAAVSPNITSALTLPDANVGVPYSQGVSATGTSPITWAVISGTLPTGLTLDANTGVISGTPATAGVSTAVIRASNVAGTDSETFTLTVLQVALVPVITAPVALSGGILRATYSQTLSATGSGPLTWTVDSGALPPGLALNSVTGLIFGVPTAVGISSFVVRVTNPVGSDTRAYQITVVGESMTIGTSATCDSFKVELLQGIHNFSASTGDTFKLALYTPTASLSTSTLTYTPAGEISSAGYTVGGATLTNITPVLAGGVAVADFDNPVFVPLTATVRYALIYNASKANRAVAVFDFGQPYVLESSGLEVVMPAPTATSAIVRVT